MHQSLNCLKEPHTVAIKVNATGRTIITPHSSIKVESHIEGLRRLRNTLLGTCMKFDIGLNYFLQKKITSNIA